MTEKVTESIKLHLPERLKRDVQDAAMVDDRKVSEWIRHVLALHLYGRRGNNADHADAGDSGLRGE